MPPVRSNSARRSRCAPGAIVGPVVASAVMGIGGPEGLYLFTAAGHVTMAGFAIWRIRQRAVPVDRSAFSAAREAAQTVSTSFEVAVLRDEAHDAERE